MMISSQTSRALSIIANLKCLENASEMSGYQGSAAHNPAETTDEGFEPADSNPRPMIKDTSVLRSLCSQLAADGVCLVRV